MNEAKIFVAMPFENELDTVLYVIRSICRKEGYSEWRADENLVSENVFSKIIGKIAESDVVIADITFNNPNVFLEIGYSWAIGKEVLLIAKNLSNLPFDVSGYTVFPYNSSDNALTIENALRLPIMASVKKALENSHLKLPILQIVQDIAKFEKKDHIYYKLLETHLKGIKHDVENWLCGSMEVNRQKLIKKGIEIFDLLKRGGFATYLVPIEEYWAENDAYVEKSRQIAKDKERNLQIERVYILFSQKSLISEKLISSIIKDEENNISTYIVFEKHIGKEALKDFGLWDDSVVCMIETFETGDNELEVIGGVFSQKDEDIDKYKEFKNEIMRRPLKGSELVKEYKSLSNEKLLLFQSVFEMAALSKNHCKGGYLSLDNCDWYHQSWQYLRLVNLVSTPTWHERFYQKALRNILPSLDNARILISGTADYGMLHQIHKTNLHDRILEVMVLDACETPLEICKYYHNYHKKICKNDTNFELSVMKADIKDNGLANDRYDILITDAFLTRFSHDERNSIISEWERLLKPNGHIITTIRNEKVDSIGNKVENKKKDVDRYVHKVKKVLDNSGPILKQLSKNIVDSAELYAKKIVSYPVSDKDKIQTYFKNFKVDVELNRVDGEVNENTTYFQVVAQKST